MVGNKQKANHERYLFVPRVLIFLTRGEQILLLKGAPYKKLWANLYNGVGGHVEQGEDVLSAAHRELLEETGLKADDLWLCGMITIDTGSIPGIVIFILRGENPSGKLIESPEGTLEWIGKSKIIELPLVEDLPSLIPIVLSTQQGMPPFFAHYTYDNDGNLTTNFFHSS